MNNNLLVEILLEHKATSCLAWQADQCGVVCVDPDMCVIKQKFHQRFLPSCRMPRGCRFTIPSAGSSYRFPEQSQMLSWCHGGAVATDTDLSAPRRSSEVHGNHNRWVGSFLGLLHHINEPPMPKYNLKHQKWLNSYALETDANTEMAISRKPNVLTRSFIKRPIHPQKCMKEVWGCCSGN